MRAFEYKVLQYLGLKDKKQKNRKFFFISTNNALYIYIYRVSIKSFPDYKHLLQENYMEYKYIFLPLLMLVSKILVICLL